jgi:chaperonin GroES
MAKTGFLPAFERVLILPNKKEDVTETGIVLPVEARKRPNIGTVIECGPLVADSKLPIKVGDTVLYQRYAGMDITLHGELYHLVMANDVLGIFDSPEDAIGVTIGVQ